MGNETNITCDYTELTPEEDLFLKSYAWWIEIIGNLLVGIIGFVLNFITLIVLSTKSMRNNFFNRLLMCLAIFDNLYLACEISEVFRHRHYTFGQQHAFVNFVYPVRSVFMFSSIYMTIALTLERYQAITNPVQYRIRGQTNMTKRLFYYVMPILTFAILYYTPKLLDLNVDEVTKCTEPNATTVLKDNNRGFNSSRSSYFNCTTTFPLIPTKLRVDHHYVFWYINISNLLLTALIPVGVLMYLNCQIYSSLNQFMSRQPSSTTNNTANGGGRRQQANDVKKTFILFSIVIIFVICHSIRVTLNIDEFINLTRFKEERQKGCQGVKFWAQVVVPLNQLLIILNSSGNFFIYVFFDQGFQQVLRQACIIRSELLGHDRKNNDVEKTRKTEHTRVNDTNNDIELSNLKGQNV